MVVGPVVSLPFIRPILRVERLIGATTMPIMGWNGRAGASIHAPLETA